MRRSQALSALVTCNGGDDALSDKPGETPVGGGEADLGAGEVVSLFFVGVTYGERLDGASRLQSWSVGLSMYVSPSFSSLSRVSSFGLVAGA